jgi:hypothetical protein
MIFTKMKCPNPNCDKVLIIQVEMKGRKGKCEKCGFKFLIPDLAPKKAGELTIIARRFAGDDDSAAVLKEAPDTSSTSKVLPKPILEPELSEEPPPLPPEESKS